MLRIKSLINQSYLMIRNPNDTLDFVVSIQEQLNQMLSENDERVIKKVKISYGASKKTSEQNSEEYDGVKGFATLLKKSISAGTQGYFTGNRDRWKYTVYDNDNNEKIFKKFDNHIKINFQCKSALERETLKTMVLMLLTFRQSNLSADICDLDYMEDVEIIKDELFEFNVYIYARTKLSFEYDHNQERLTDVDYIVGIKTEKQEETESENDDEEFSNGF